MKKTLISGLILASVLSPTLVLAQEVQPVTQEQITQLEITIRELLMQLIAQLQAQLTELLAQQVAQTTQFGTLQTQVNTVVQNTTPVLGGVVAPIPVDVALGDVQCLSESDPVASNRTSIKVPFLVSGSWTKIEYTYDRYVGSSATGYSFVVQGGIPYPRVTSNVISATPQTPYLTAFNVPGTYHVSGKAYDANGSEIDSFSLTKTIGDECPRLGISYAIN